MSKDKVVVAKRGCTCCGTGCVLAAPLAALGTFALWDVAGAVAAIAIWPTLIVCAHLVRYATDQPTAYVRYPRRRTNKSPSR